MPRLRQSVIAEALQQELPMFPLPEGYELNLGNGKLKRSSKNKSNKRGGNMRKSIISDVLDLGLPVAGAALGSAVSGGPGIGTALGAVAGRTLRGKIKSKYGYGKGGSKKTMKNLGKTLISTGLDTIPTIAGFAGSSLGTPTAGLIAQAAAKIVREGIRYKTGLGRPSKARKAVSYGLDIAVPYGVEKLYQKIDPDDYETGQALGRAARKGVKKLTGFGSKQKRGGKRKLSREHISNMLDVAIPSAASLMYDHILDGEAGAANSGRIMGHVARSGLKKLTGVGHFEPQKKQKKPLKKGDKRLIRGAVLKLLMDEGMSFSEASQNVSQYIKDHNL